MAATLPPINNRGQNGVGNRNVFMPTPPRGPPSGRLQPIKVPGKAERDLFFKQEKLRQQQPELSKKQTTRFRNSYKHNLCLDMLQDGYHKSFSELFALIKQQEEERQRQGEESLMWTMVMLKDQHEKLDMLKQHLCKAEEAERKGDFGEVYRSRYELARYFQSGGDKWLADHFFTTCLQTSAQVKGDNGKTQAQGYLNVGLALEEQGDVLSAAEHFEAYYKLSVDHREWIQADNLTFHTDACINLWRIYSSIAASIEEEDSQESLDYLIKALKLATESQDKELQGIASYRLGHAYEQNGDGETALLHLNEYLKICTAESDSEGIGKACDAIAKAYAKQGKVEESITYLKKFVEVAEKSGEEVALSKACHNLGNIFNSLGRYSEATEYFSKSYNLSRSLGDKEAISTNRVQFGIAMAHKMMKGLDSHTVMGTRPALERLIEWKNARVDDFEKPFPEPKKEEPKPREPTPPPPQSQVTEETEQEPQEEEKVDDSKTKSELTDDTSSVTETTAS
ncbi:tetratricopeptide repeat protein 29-like isoform X1 [Mytilus californianus]|uniref:tetratricopeptide repeat protein 29-like isoform X1 n=1 Tax=Mytilus californianus TaxID=6549 RepID=UPI002245A5E7|nr:tetratricopeptide repeat protein 29-like isoform X1 [Mytilus californianus]